MWIISKKKKQPNTTLFIDGRKLGSMTSRTIRELLDDDIKKIAQTYQSYVDDEGYFNEIAFCYKATLDEIRKKNYNISPTKYVVGSLDAEEIPDWVDQRESNVKMLLDFQERSMSINSEIANPIFLELLMRNCPDYFLSLIKPGAREGQVLDKDELSKKLIIIPPIQLQNRYIVLYEYFAKFYFWLEMR